MKSVFQLQQKYRPKQAIIEETKLEDSSEQRANDSQVSLYYDAEWISILQETQKLMPLSNYKYDFSYLSLRD